MTPSIKIENLSKQSRLRLTGIVTLTGRRKFKGVLRQAQQQLRQAQQQLRQAQQQLRQAQQQLRQAQQPRRRCQAN